MSKPVLYTDDALIIKIPTRCPAHLHQQLLRAVAAVLKQQIIQPAEDSKERESIAVLATLQATLLPTEEQLEKIFE